MGDPLSISAGIAGLVTLADVAFSRTYKYVKAVKNASKEITALSSELCALYGVLCSVRSIAIQLEDEAPGIAARSQCINSCQKTLEEIQGILDRDKTSSLQDERWETTKRKLHWPFKSSEVKSLLSDIERHKQTLGLALEADGIAGLLQVLSGQKGLHSSLEEIKKHLCLTREIETRIMLNESRENILRTFGKIDPRRTHDMSRKLRHPGTGIWLTESPKFQHWLHSANGCLWLYGIPGAGKTVLASLVIDEVMPKSTPNHAVAYFYCDYKDQMTQEPHGILGSLAQQISKQDEQSFEKLRGFYEDHGQGRKEPVPYDPTLLRKLISDMITNFDSATIIIDALDECVGNERDVTELLTSLGETTGDTNVKLLLLSRDEFEIRNFLDASPQISIAAENSDLRLYVGYEIEERMRKNRLRIKSPSLKELIVERLINGAEGMFRWVTCQIDHLCELPSDAARRKALQDLPRGLTLTYERILSRVDQKGAEAQQLVRRTLNWLFCRKYPFGSGALSQAVAISLRDAYINVDAIPDVSDILHHCGSLVRISADGRDVEFAHFTVKEFLSQLDATKNSGFAAFVMNADYVHNELAKICLTYINMQDFDQYEEINNEIHTLRIEKHPFKFYANYCWPEHVRDWNDTELVELVKKLLHPAKPSTLVSWAQEALFPYAESDPSAAIATIGAGIKEATALHYAAMLCIPEICEWLIENGCDVNRWSAFGTPLQCAIVTLKGFCGDGFWIDICIDLPSSTRNQLRTLDVLLRAGSNPNKAIDKVIDQVSTLSLALKAHKPCTLAVKLLENGSHFSEKNLQDILEECETEHDYQQVEQCFRLLVQKLSTSDIEDMTQQKTLKRAQAEMARNKVRDLRALQPCKFLIEETAFMEGAELESSMRTAAEFGQLEPMVQLLNQYRIPVDTACEGNRETALHLAAANDHLEIIKALIDRGASTAAADNVGRTALHHSIRRSGCNCLQFFLDIDPNVNLPDNQGMTPWHLAIVKDNIEALKLLKERGRYRAWPSPDTMASETSALSYAAEKTPVDLMPLLISAGCSVRGLKAGGLTSLHYAAKACSLECIRFLVENGSIISPLTEDGSSPLHYAVAAKNAKKDEVVAFLVSKGSNPFLARHDGLTSIDVLIEGGSGELSLEVTGRVLQTLINWKSPNGSVDMDLSQQLLRLSQLELISQSQWLFTALKILLDNGAELMRETKEGKTAFGILLYSWQQQFSRLSVVEVKKLRLPANKATMIIRTALDHVPAETLLGPGRDLSNLLLSAVTFGDEELARRLLQFSPDVDRPTFVDGEEWSPIGAACFWHCSDDLCKSLLDRSKALSDQAQATKLFAYVSGAERITLAETLLEAGFNPNGRSIHGVTPLMQSARNGDAKMVRWLIEHGGDVKAVDRNGWNAAHYACTAGRLGDLIIMSLLKTTDIDWHGKVRAKFGRNTFSDVSLLHLAASQADDICLKYLIYEGLAQDLNCTTAEGLTPLHVAVLADRFDSVALLLSKNVKTNVTSYGASPLHLVAILGHQKMYSLFRSRHCDLEMLDKYGLDCEMLALKNGHHELAGQIATDAAQRQNQTSLSQDFHAKKPLRMLKLAIELGDLGLCEKALAAGVNLEVGLPDCNGSTPLSYCVEMKKPGMAKFLVLKGASDISVARKPSRGHGFTLFHYAAECNNSALLEALLQKASWQLLQNVAPVHPIHIAILASARECVELMLHHNYRNFQIDSTSVLQSHEHVQRAEYLRRCDAPAPLAKTGAAYLANMPIGDTLDHGWETYRARGYFLHKLSSFTPLHLAAWIGDCDCAETLLSVGSLVNAVTSRYWTPLHFAAYKDHGNMARLLLASGAQAFSRNTDGNTPSMEAAFAGHLEVLRPLLESGIDLEMRDYAQQTILHLAARSSSTAALVHIMTTIKDYDLESESAWGYTVLILAFRNSSDGIGSLMNLGPSPRAYTPRKFNVLTAAIGNRFMTIQNVKMLLKRIPSELFTLILNHRAYIGGTPLYAACTLTDTRREIGIINLLLDAGAHIDQDGGQYGTPLMAACTVGRLSAVKLLVSRGAQTWFVKDGQTTNVLTAAKRFPDIIYWLLVGRFAEGPRCLTWVSSMN